MTEAGERPGIGVPDMVYSVGMSFGEGFRAGVAGYRQTRVSRSFRVAFIYIPGPVWIVLGLLWVAGVHWAIIATKIAGAVTVIGVVVEFVMMPAVIVWYLYRMRRAARKHPAQVQIGFSKLGMTVTTDVSHGELDWRAFQRIVETSEFIHFFLNKQTAITLPKRVLEGDDQLVELRHRIATALGDRAKLLL